TKDLVCVAKHAWKLKLLSDLGIKTAFADEPLMRGADVVVEATGSHQGFERALELVRPEGTVVLKTTVAHPTALELSGPVINEIKIIGSRCGPFRPALEALSLGNVGVRPMVTDTFSLSDADQALARAGEPGVMKVLIHM
ncbi:MAG: zinc-binding dehydrogenase, partial [Candidatus Hydrogenedentes bacterium]|nr:zinc-binding dehydrogenase [Candidatus Hydrogenedentota bacterium]